MPKHPGAIQITVAWIVSVMALSLTLASGPATAPGRAEDTPGSNGVKDPDSLKHRDNRYLLAPGDVIDLSFALAPEFNQTVTIAPDGYISLRDVGGLHASGESLPDLEASVETAYSSILHKPVVSVALKDFQKPYFTVGGEVGHPGKFELRENTTVTEGVTIAGGFLASSKHSQVLLFRRLPGGNFLEARKLDVKAMLKEGNLDEDMYLRPGDMIYVPKNTIAKIDRFIPTSSMSIYAPVAP